MRRLFADHLAIGTAVVVVFMCVLFALLRSAGH
jgi:hypothetical protein